MRFIVLALVFTATVVNGALIREKSELQPAWTRFPAFQKLREGKLEITADDHKTSFTPRKDILQADNCGISEASEISSKIVGGVIAEPHEFPWQVAIKAHVGFKNYFCGGTLITDQYVLTAAHCVDGIESFDVILGAVNIKDDEDFTVQIHTTKAFTHEDWDSERLKNDVAIIDLGTSVNTSGPFIRTSCLANSGFDDLAGEVAVASGWGRYSDMVNQISPQLRKVEDLPVIENSVCNAYFHGYVTKGNICIASTGGHGTCQGDSGGPLHYRANKQGPYVQVGVTSFGAAAGCESGYPDAFSRVSYFADWISNKTGLSIE